MLNFKPNLKWRDIRLTKNAAAVASDIDAFPPPRTCLTPHSGWTPCDINVTYTWLKGALNGLQFRHWQYGSIFILLAVIASETREMLWNSKRIWPNSSARSSKVINLGVNRKHICDFLLVINCNFSRICYRFRDIQAYLKIENCWFYPSSLVWGPCSGGTP